MKKIGRKKTGNNNSNFNIASFKGVVRDRSKTFFNSKRTGNHQYDRFKPKKESLFKDFHDRHSDDCEDPNASLLNDPEDFNAADGFGTNRREKHILPPRWVDQEEQVEENLIEVSKHLSGLESEIGKIKNHKYMTESEIPTRKIEQINTEIITLIKQSENELKDIMASQMANQVDDKIRKNVNY